MDERFTGTTMLICDYAEAINGKLYIMGGGWSACSPGPRHLSIAIRILVPWSEANVKHRLTLMLQDESGNTIELGEPPRRVEHSGDFEVGRPAGLPQGSDLAMVLAVSFMGLPLEADRGYRWQLEIDGEPTANASFRTVSVRPGS